MNLKYLIIIFLLLVSNQILCQKVKSDLKDIERFCCYEWLPELRDSIFIVVEESKVNQSAKYCVLKKAKRRHYELHCWTGSSGLESPTIWSAKLTIRFKRNFAFLKFGKRKATYQIFKLSKEEYLLIKIKNKPSTNIPPFTSISPGT